MKACEFCGAPAAVYGGFAGAGSWAGFACFACASRTPGFSTWDVLDGAATTWASADEIADRVEAETVPTYDFRIRDEWDNGEFVTGATVDLIVRGKVIHTETFTASSEDAPGPGFSAYGNGLDNHAGTLARSYAWAWLDGCERPLEERYAPFGEEWIREREEETAWAR